MCSMPTLWGRRAAMSGSQALPIACMNLLQYINRALTAAGALCERPLSRPAPAGSPATRQAAVTLASSTAVSLSRHALPAPAAAATAAAATAARSTTPAPSALRPPAAARPLVMAPAAALQLLDLPPDLLARIGTQLPFNERLQLSLVCRRWRDVCAGPSQLWSSIDACICRGVSKHTGGLFQPCVDEFARCGPAGECCVAGGALVRAGA